MRAAIKVLVVDDSALIRQLLTRALAVDPRIEIVGIAKTGVEAIEKARTLRPDVITLDIEMPELSGIEALPHLRKHTDARVVMLSSLDDPDTTYQALAAGAVDFISKPKAGFATSLSELSEVLLKKIHIAFRVDPERLDRTVSLTQRPAEPSAEEIAERSAGAPEATRQIPPARNVTRGTTRAVEHVVAIAASTGGPPALERVFVGLSATLPAAYLVVQHLPTGFSASLARRLSSASDIEVVEAVEGMRVTMGMGLLAPYGTHMTVLETSPGVHRIHLDDSPPQHGVRPSADPLFASVAGTFGPRAIGVLLTGMGSDGAAGLAEIKASGGATIAQNEETSVVWGMPGVAYKLGAVQHLAPIGLIAAEVRRIIRGGLAS